MSVSVITDAEDPARILAVLRTRCPQELERAWVDGGVARKSP